MHSSEVGASGGQERRPHETGSFDRRRFLHAAWASGALAFSLPPALRAATAGRALLGFQVPNSFAVIIEAVLASLQGRYEPDLGRRPVLLPGGAGALAADIALKAPTDGATALIAPSGYVTLLPDVRKLPDDPLRRLVPVAGIGRTTIAFVVGPKVPQDVRSMADYFAWVRGEPVMARFGVPGFGTSMHFVGLEVTRSAGIALKAVSFRSLQPLFEELVGGAIPAAMTVVPDVDFAASHPTIRVIGVASDERWPTFPDVPTFKELGLMQDAVSESLGFFFVEGTPAAKITELATAISTVVAMPDIVQLMKGVMSPMARTDLTYAQLLAGERERWLALARRLDD